MWVIFSALFAGAVFAPDSWLIGKNFGDTETLSSMVSGGLEARGSYGATAAVFSALGPLTKPFLAVVGVVVLRLLLFPLKRLVTMGLALVLIFPGLFLGGVRPQKDVLVLGLSAVAVMIAYSAWQSDWKRRLAIAFLYGAYGGLIRAYYLMIVGVFSALWALGRLPKVLAVVVVLLGLILFFWIPIDLLAHSIRRSHWL